MDIITAVTNVGSALAAIAVVRLLDLYEGSKRRRWAKEDQRWQLALDACRVLSRETVTMWKDDKIQNKKEVLTSLDAAMWVLPREQAQCCFDLSVHILRSDQYPESRSKIPGLQDELKNGVRKALGLGEVRFAPRP